MPVKTFKPVTPSLRHMSVATFEEITKTKPEKSLTVRMKKHAGRNFRGKITVRHRGGGYIKKYRMIDFNSTDKLNIEAKVSAIEYDPNRTSYIMLLTYKDGEKRYQIAPEGIKVGETIVTKERAKIKTGNRMMIKHVPVGYNVYNIELYSGKGGQMTRSAGSSAKLVSLEGDYAQIQLSSGEVRLVGKECYVSVGIVGNIDHNNVKIGKAGKKRHMGWRPTVRGSVMNPKDHPHGGGEGRTGIGLKHPKTPWGLPALGFKTRKRHYTDRFIVQDRRKKQAKA